MIKITITIEETSENKVKKNNTINGKYIIARSNFGEAFILGVPCKVVSEPFMDIYLGSEKKCIKIRSCITGIQYTIPYSMKWFDVYDTFADVLMASESFLHRGYAIYPNPEVTRGITRQVFYKKYYPMDNSHSKLLFGNGDSWVAGKEVEIVSEPYIDITNYGKKVPFINVRKDDGSIVKCIFMEWKFLP